jgi:UDP-N-acetyl-D-mannosaminuronate dehydrogenase
MGELAEEINTAAPLYVAGRLRDLLNDRSRAVRGARVLLLGVTYKANISDCRESPADPLAKQLLAWGADLFYHDPFVPVWHPHGVDVTLESVTDLEQAVRDADVVVLLQTHAQYSLGDLADAAKVLLDTRGVVAGHPHVEVL